MKRGFSRCMFCICSSTQTHTPQYRRAAPFSCVWCLTAHPSPPGTDLQELKHMMEKTQNNLTLICTQLTYHHIHSAHTHCRREKTGESPIWSYTHRFFGSLQWKKDGKSKHIHPPPHTVKWQSCCCCIDCFTLFSLKQRVSRACMFVLINWRKREGEGVLIIPLESVLPPPSISTWLRGKFY